MAQSAAVHRMAEPRSPEQKVRKDLEEMIREDPWRALAIAAAIGFFTGGGLRSRTAWALMVLGGRVAARQMVSNYVMGAITNGGGRGNHQNRK